MPPNVSLSSRDKLKAGIFTRLVGFDLVFSSIENGHLHSLH